jgi:hypothetical protein
MEVTPPRLIENSTRSYLYETLQKCRQIRTNTYSTAFNLSILALFILVFGSALYYCYNNKKTPEEMHEKMVRDQEYVLSKIRFYQSEKHKATTSNLTNLPMA